MVTIRRTNPGWLNKLLKRYEGGPVLAVGWPVGTSGVAARYPDGTSVLMVAAVNQFGATIQHPGGTGYTVGPNGARFVNKEFTGPVAGVTGAHTIDIPQRDFMTPGGVMAMQDTKPIAEALLPALNSGKATAEQILGHMGPFAQAAFQRAIAKFTSPGNAPSTIAQKGDDNPLEDTGLLRNSLTYIVRQKQS